MQPVRLSAYSPGFPKRPNYSSRPSRGFSRPSKGPGPNHFPSKQAAEAYMKQNGMFTNRQQAQNYINSQNQQNNIRKSQAFSPSRGYGMPSRGYGGRPNSNYGSLPGIRQGPNSNFGTFNSP